MFISLKDRNKLKVYELLVPRLPEFLSVLSELKTEVPHPPDHVCFFICLSALGFPIHMVVTGTHGTLESPHRQDGLNSLSLRQGFIL